MIRINYLGRLGNQMCQYAFARLLAEALGYRLAAESLPAFPNTRGVVDGVIADGEEVTMTDLNNVVPPDTIAAIAVQYAGHRVRLHGHFEQSSYFLPQRERVRHWFDGPADTRFENVVCLRGTDVRTNTDVHLGADYYRAALNIVGRQNTVIITDDPQWDYVRSFGLPAFNLGQQDNFRCFRGAKRIVLSKSTFSWWAAFLGNPELVVQPEPATGWRSLQTTPHRYLGVPSWTKLAVP